MTGGVRNIDTLFEARVIFAHITQMKEIIKAEEKK